ncbi:VCBS repeat-containing protein, partial [Candidatus Heimdallarchaeota archaeon]
MAFKGKYLIIITIVSLMVGSVTAQSYNYANLLDSIKSIRQTTPSSVSSLNISIEKSFQATSLSTVFKEPFWINEEIFGTVVSSPTLTDLNNDGELEIIILTDNNLIYILDKSGNFLPDWGAPYAKSVPELTSKSSIAPCPIPIDITGDEDLEILCATYGGLVYCWFLDGGQVPGFPINLNGSITASPAVGDIDGDSQNEIVIGNWYGELFALEKNGSICPGFPFKTNNSENIMGAPAIGNLDSDIAEEIVFGAYDRNTYVLKGNGSLLPGWPQTANDNIKSSPALIDFDNDGTKEIMIGSWDKKLYLFNANGSQYNHWPWTSASSITNSPVISDINLDGYYDA